MGAIWFRFRAEFRTRWMGALVLAVFAVANAVAYVLGRVAARTQPALVLRSE